MADKFIQEAPNIKLHAIKENISKAACTQIGHSKRLGVEVDRAIKE